MRRVSGQKLELQGHHLAARPPINETGFHQKTGKYNFGFWIQWMVKYGYIPLIGEESVLQYSCLASLELRTGLSLTTGAISLETCLSIFDLVN